MAKKSFGNGSVADFIRAAEEEERSQKEMAIANASAVSEQHSESTAEAVEAERSVEAGSSAPQQAAGKSSENSPVQEQTAATTAVAPAELVGRNELFTAATVLSKEHKYKNTAQQVNIAEDFYVFLRAVSKQYDITVAQMVNNMVRPYLTDKGLRKEIKSLAQKKFRDAINSIDELD
ncbi:MAG: hypothetical protein LBT70_04760 [Holosporaceae bacterium]|jgi:cell pole-organizing protein PopZ|nr:hypothetical protein [Holosporaceae bacterium]